jgi:hypothetical protein
MLNSRFKSSGKSSWQSQVFVHHDAAEYWEKNAGAAWEAVCEFFTIPRNTLFAFE